MVPLHPAYENKHGVTRMHNGGMTNCIRVNPRFLRNDAAIFVVHGLTRSGAPAALSTWQDCRVYRLPCPHGGVKLAGEPLRL